MNRLVIACVVLFCCIAHADPNDVCHVGAQLHLQPGKAIEHAAAFVECGMADYALLVAQALDAGEREAVVRYLAEHKVHFLIQENLPTAGHWRYTAQDYERMRQIAGEFFLGIHWGELDSSGLKPEMYLPKAVFEHPTRRRVKAAFVNYVRQRVDYVHENLHVPCAHSSALLYHPLFAEAGVDVLCSEVGENIPNIGMMIASNRGAARAYNRPWMIDFSTWWAPRGHVGEQVSPREGHTPWCLFSGLLEAAMGGADYAQLEVDWAALDKDRNVLSWGRALKTLCDLSRQIGPRGNTVTRLAILLGHENGWPGVGWRIGDVRGTGLFDGIRHEFMQTRDADLSLKLLDVFYPGFERCGWDPEYPGFLAESPLGTVDFVPDNLPPERYGRYAVLVALGAHRATESLRAALIEYVRRGGILVCGDTLFLDEHEKPVSPKFIEPLIGAQADLRKRNLIRLYQPAAEIDAVEGCVTAATRQEWQAHWLHPVRLTTGRTVARFNTTPYLVEHRIGAGRVFFITALNMVGNSAERRGQEPFLFSNLSYYFLHSLKEHVGDGIAFAPWTGLEYVFNEQPGGGGQLLIMNHGDMPYRRDARMRNPRGYTTGRVLAEGTWEGWQPGNELAFTEAGATLAWSFTLPPKSFILFEFRAR